MKVTEWSKSNKVISERKVMSISHFGVVRDYLLHLKGGRIIELSWDIVNEIVKHEKLENVSYGKGDKR